MADDQQAPPTSDADPLVRSRAVRMLAAFGLCVAGFVGSGLAALVTLLLTDSGWLAGLVGGVLLAGCLLSAVAVELGRWKLGVQGAAQRAGAGALVAVCLAVAVYGTWRAVDVALELRTLGTPPETAAFALAGVAAAGFGLALLVALLPPALPRRVRWRTAIGAVAAGSLAAAASAAADVAPNGCSRFAFSTERWRDALTRVEDSHDAWKLAESIDRCGVISAGMSRERVRALLGRPAYGDRTYWAWPVGGDDALLFERYGQLDVSFRGDRVTSVAVVWD